MRYLLSLTAFAALSAATAQTPGGKLPFPTPEQNKQSAAFIESLQQTDGGYTPLPAKPGVSSLRATNAAVKAIRYFGAAAPKKEKTIEFVTSCFDKSSGGYADAPGGKVEVGTTAVGMMAAAELGLKDSPYLDRALDYLAANAKGFEEIRIAAAGFEAAGKCPRDPANRWLTETERLRNPDGSYGKPADDARMTGSALALLLRLEGRLNEAQQKASLEVLRNGQRPDGAYSKKADEPSELETTYRVMRAFHMLLDKPPEPGNMRQFIQKCRNADGGYGVAPGQPSSMSGTYYAAIILHWLDEAR